MELVIPAQQRPSLILAIENGGVAHALARITDSRLLRSAIASAAKAKRTQALRSKNEFLSRRLLREAHDLESLR